MPASLLPSCAAKKFLTSNVDFQHPASGAGFAQSPKMPDSTKAPQPDCQTISVGTSAQAQLQEPKNPKRAERYRTTLMSYFARATHGSDASRKNSYPFVQGPMGRFHKAHPEKRGLDVRGDNSARVQNAGGWPKNSAIENEQVTIYRIAKALEKHFRQVCIEGEEFSTEAVIGAFVRVQSDRRWAIMHCIIQYAAPIDRDYVVRLPYLMRCFEMVDAHHWHDVITLLVWMAPQVGQVTVRELGDFVANLGVRVEKEEINILECTAQCIWAADNFGSKERYKPVSMFHIYNLVNSIANAHEYDWNDVMAHVQQIAACFRSYRDWAEAIACINWVLPKYRASLLQLTDHIVQERLTNAALFSESAYLQVMDALVTWINPNMFACLTLNEWPDCTGEWSVQACIEAIKKTPTRSTPAAYAESF